MKALRDAGRLARHLATSSAIPISLVSAADGPIEQFAPWTSLMPPGTHVWAVVFRGAFGQGCGPFTASPHPCPSPSPTELVVIDDTNGTFILARAPASDELDGPAST